MELPDEDLRKIAKARVGFRMHALSYVVVNLLILASWFITSDTRRPTFVDSAGGDYFWPVWPLLGWGVGLAMHGWGVYGAGKDWEEREYEKLKAQQGRR